MEDAGTTRAPAHWAPVQDASGPDGAAKFFDAASPSQREVVSARFCTVASFTSQRFGGGYSNHWIVIVGLTSGAVGMSSGESVGAPAGATAATPIALL